MEPTQRTTTMIKTCCQPGRATGEPAGSSSSPVGCNLESNLDDSTHVSVTSSSSQGSGRKRSSSLDLVDSEDGNPQSPGKRTKRDESEPLSSSNDASDSSESSQQSLRKRSSTTRADTGLDRDETDQADSVQLPLHQQSMGPGKTPSPPTKRVKRNVEDDAVTEQNLLSLLSAEEQQELKPLVEKYTKLSEQVAELWNRAGLVRCHLRRDPVRSLACHAQALAIYQTLFTVHTECGIDNCPDCQLSSKEAERRNVLFATVYSDMGLCHERMQQNDRALSCYSAALGKLTVSFGTDCCACPESVGSTGSNLTETPSQCCGPKFLSESVKRGIARLKRT
jgi:hypothetical protein